MIKKPVASHLPVLLSEVVSVLSLKKGETLVDATLGEGGHSLSLCPFLGKEGLLVGFELDPGALARAVSRLEDAAPRKMFFQKNYREMGKILPEAGISKVDAILFDLGLGSHQLNEEERGFSFKAEGPLSMRFDSGPGVNAADLINAATEDELCAIIAGYGEEPRAGIIARAIVAKRKEKPITKAKELREIIWQAVPPKARHGRIDPATKTFQALRIAVNDELSAVAEGLSAGFQLLSSGGRMVVISFHSLEDRIVKNFFKEKKESGEGELYGKKPITALAGETLQNPRSRSAKLRLIKKI